MGRPSSKKGESLGHRDLIRCRLIAEFMPGLKIASFRLRDSFYSSTSESSFHKTFSRDRDALAQEGVYLEETSSGSSKYWALNPISLADTTAASETERRTVAILLKAAKSAPDLATPNSLSSSIARIGQSGSVDIQQSPMREPYCDQTILAALSEALHTRTPINLSYRRAGDARAHKCILYPYGMFSLGRSIYVVGLRTIKDGEDAVHTFSTERIHGAKLLTTESPYTIPEDFSLDSYRLLPFEIGAETAQDCSFLVEKDLLSTFETAVHGRGAFEKSKGNFVVWKCSELKNTPMAASWAIEVGAMPLSPASLVEQWKALNEGALA